eukprot:3701759-Rhodomonas_salina.1
MPLKKGSAEHVIALSSPVIIVETKSAYELEREANIRRNDQVLAAIGLADPSHETPKTVRKRPRAQMSESDTLAPRRSLRMSLLPTPDVDASTVSGDQSSTEETGCLSKAGSAPRKAMRSETGKGEGRGKQARGSGPTASGEASKVERGGEDTEETEEESKGAVAPLHGRPPSSHEFARLVLKCIKRIPAGRVASYGQLAAMAGLPRNSRQ